MRHVGLVLLLVLLFAGASVPRAYGEGVPPPLSANPPVPANGLACSIWLARFQAFMNNASSCFWINRVPQFHTVSTNSSFCFDAVGNVIFLPTMTLTCI